jgi:hypothetical protein
MKLYSSGSVLDPSGYGPCVLGDMAWLGGIAQYPFKQIFGPLVSYICAALWLGCSVKQRLALDN